MTDIVDRLYDATDRDAASDAAEEIVALRSEVERLKEKCDKQATILRRLNPENFPDTYFICGELGEKDQNGLPEKIMIVPAYGVDWMQIYQRNDKVTGPEW